MKKRMISMLMALCVMLVMLPVSVSAEEIASGTMGVYEKIDWSISKDGMLTISGDGAIPNSLIYSPWANYNDQITGITVMEGITAIGDRAFYYLDNVGSVSLPDSLIRIGHAAFSCTQFAEITIPAGVSEIEGNVFANNISLRHIWVDEANPNFSSDSYGMLFNKDKTKLILCPPGYAGDYVIPEGVREIMDGAFSACDQLTGIQIPGTVENMGTGTFLICYALKEVVLEEGITTIPRGVFSYCDKIKEITIPSTVTLIETEAFSACTGLETVTFTGDAPVIDEWTFSADSFTAYYPAENETWTENVKQNYGGNITWVHYRVDHPHTYDDNVDGICNICGVNRETVETRQVHNMLRMYNPNSGEHFYTGSEEERDMLVEAGWNYEGIAFTFPANTGAPVHRLYHEPTGEHLYTMDEAEKDRLLSEGWNYEGVAFNSAYDTEAVQHRLHNPNATVGAYHFTFSAEEKQMLIDAGWEYQGIGWYSCWK